MLVGIARIFTKITYLLQETLLGLRRGGWLNWAAVSTLTVLLFLVGISLELSWGVEATVESLGTQLEISVYLDQETPGAELQSMVEAIPHVQEVRLIPREQAWKELLQDMGITDQDALQGQLGDNPLVDALRVRGESADTLDGIANQVKQLPGVDEVHFGDDVVFQLDQLQDSLKLGSLTITGVLSLTTVAVITTTIRLIVMARRREIEVMQLVGATAIWIYLPFILQGMLFGLMGSAGAWGLILGSQQVLQDLLTRLIALPFLEVGRGEDWHQVMLPLVLMGMGLMMGTTSSLIAVRKSTLR